MWVFSVLVPVEVSNYQPLDDNRETNTSKARKGGVFRTYEYVPRIHSIVHMYVCVCTEFRRIAHTRPKEAIRVEIELLYGAYGKKAGKVILRDVIGQIKRLCRYISTSSSALPASCAQKDRMRKCRSVPFCARPPKSKRTYENNLTHAFPFSCPRQ